MLSTKSDVLALSLYIQPQWPLVWSRGRRRQHPCQCRAGERFLRAASCLAAQATLRTERIIVSPRLTDVGSRRKVAHLAAFHFGEMLKQLNSIVLAGSQERKEVYCVFVEVVLALSKL